MFRTKALIQRDESDDGLTHVVASTDEVDRASDIVAHVQGLLAEIQANLFERAAARTAETTSVVDSWDDFLAKTGKGAPIGRMGDAQEFATIALFLASDLSSWITGHTLVVDGGALIAAA